MAVPVSQGLPVHKAQVIGGSNCIRPQHSNTQQQTTGSVWVLICTVSQEMYVSHFAKSDHTCGTIHTQQTVACSTDTCADAQHATCMIIICFCQVKYMLAFAMTVHRLLPRMAVIPEDLPPLALQ